MHQGFGRGQRLTGGEGVVRRVGGVEREGCGLVEGVGGRAEESARMVSGSLNSRSATRVTRSVEAFGRGFPAAPDMERFDTLGRVGRSVPALPIKLSSGSCVRPWAPRRSANWAGDARFDVAGPVRFPKSEALRFAPSSRALGERSAPSSRAHAEVSPPPAAPSSRSAPSSRAPTRLAPPAAPR